MGLRLWVDGEVPEGVATSVIAVLGKRGSGKTYFAGVLEVADKIAVITAGRLIYVEEVEKARKEIDNIQRLLFV
ncbi:MAG: hypothetical protein LZ173_05705 [Thaumarchaeota archaeon]|jgi:dephospho-CoA kinase|nr:hypothetical protein [Candidatus Geocrenenecus arthurdayi]